jgi:hypothetical protein
MNFKEITLVIIDLVFAIKNNNLEQTKEYVEILNNNFNPNEMEVYYLNEMLGFADLNSFNLNESLTYVLYNLKYLTNVDKIKWEIQIIQVLAKYQLNKNPSIIENFIKDSISNNAIENYQFNGLIRLCHVI